MSFALGFENHNDKTVSAVLEAKGINLLRAMPSEVSVLSVVEKVQPAYRAYLAVLPAFLHAHSVQAKTDTSVAFYPVRYPVDECFPVPDMEVTVHFEGSIPAGVTDRLKTIGYAEVKKNGKNLLVLKSPSRDDVRFLNSIQNCSKVSPAISGSINISSFGTLTLSVRIMSQALKVHHFPAFRTREHMLMISENDLFEMAGKGVKRARVQRDDGGRPRPRPGSTQVEEDEQMNDDEEATSEPLAVVRAMDVLACASPVPTRSIGWGSLGELPVCDGIYIPYLSELSSRDKKAVPTLIRTYFLGCLGSNAETVKKTMSAIESAYGTICQTETGNVLAHLASCMMIAFRSQAQCFPIFEDERYEGSAILGAGVSYTVGKNTVQSVPHDKLREIILAFGTHASSISAILNIVGMVDDDFVTPGGDKIDSMMQLRNWLADRGLTEQNKDDVLRVAGHLTFGRSWDFNSDTIIYALDLMGSDDDLPDNLPIHHSCLFARSRSELVLSCFGTLVPSPVWSSSKSWSLEKSARPNSIHFHQVTLTQAILDYENIRTSKAVTVPASRRRSGPYKDMEFKGDSGKSIFVALGKFARAVAPTGVEGGVGHVLVNTDDGLFDI